MSCSPRHIKKYNKSILIIFPKNMGQILVCENVRKKQNFPGWSPEMFFPEVPSSQMPWAITLPTAHKMTLWSLLLDRDSLNNQNPSKIKLTTHIKLERVIPVYSAPYFPHWVRLRCPGGSSIPLRIRNVLGVSSQLSIHHLFNLIFLI